jgi:CD151 antigen
MACAKDLVRYAFFLFNLVIWILGIVVLGVGIWSRVENDTWKDLITVDTITSASNLLIAAGIIVAALGFLGCCGAIKKLQTLLIGYAVLVFLIFILEIAAGAYAYTKQDEVESKLVSGVQEGMNKNYGKDDKASKGMTVAIDWFQTNVKCCGAAGPADWKKSYWYNHQTKVHEFEVPKSCCVQQVDGCNTKINNGTVFADGCIAAGKAYALSNMKLVGGVGVGIAIVELFGIVFALCLCTAFRREERGDPIS